MTIITSMTYVREGNAIDNPAVYEQHAKKLADEVKRLRDVIANTTHGRRKLEEDSVIRDNMYTAEVGESIWIPVLNDTRRITTDTEEYYGNRTYYISEKDAKGLLEKKEAFRVPCTMNYANSIYRITSSGHVVSLCIYKKDDDGGFLHSASVWIPQPDKKKYVELHMGFRRTERKGDWVTFSTNHYKQEKNFGSYLSKDLHKVGAYKPYFLEALEIYREITGNHDFLKEVKAK